MSLFLGNTSLMDFKSQGPDKTPGGTLYYMAPELRERNPKSGTFPRPTDSGDMFSVGVVLFELFAERTTFENLTDYTSCKLPREVNQILISKIVKDCVQVKKEKRPKANIALESIREM